MMGTERFLMAGNNNNNSNNNTASSSCTAAAAKAMAAEALKCPRCDSSNTKFCYYNNYSLSQPRHFCKACKRYWTRGGTLRNVPVGGGCRKNKRVKKSSPATSTSSNTTAVPTTDPQPSSLIHSSLSLPNSDVNSFFCNLPTASSDMNLTTFPNFRAISSYDLQPQMNALGLGLPSNQLQDNDQYQSAGFGTQFTNLRQSANFLNDYPSFGSQAASLLVSSLKQPFISYEEQGNFGMVKEVKVEENNVISNNRTVNEWHATYEINPFEAMNSTAVGSGDSSYLYWPDAGNSSIAPLI